MQLAVYSEQSPSGASVNRAQTGCRLAYPLWGVSAKLGGNPRCNQRPGQGSAPPTAMDSTVYFGRTPAEIVTRDTDGAVMALAFIAQAFEKPIEDL